VMVPPHSSAVDHEEELWRTIWKDVVSGGAFILNKTATDVVADVEFSPLGRVDKYDHLGRVKPTGRLIHDISHGGKESVNQRTSSEDLPEMHLPSVESVVRSVLYWKNRYPGTKVKLSKRDVDSAFRRIPLRPQGVRYFGATLGAWILLLLVLTFGWCNSPPYYSLASVAVSLLHRMFKPALPERDGPEPFESHTYLDDTMAVEPDIGSRCELSARCLEQVLELILGKGAVSQSKKDAEGEWATSKVILGLEINTETEGVTLPGPKLERLRIMLRDPRWRRGNRRLVLRDIQELVGRLVHFTTVFPPARAFLSGLLKVLADMTRAHTGLRDAVCPGLPMEDDDLTWERWWDDLDALRWLVESVGMWSVPCSSPFAVTLPPSEWEARGAGGRGVIYLGSDATEWSWCVVNWSLGQYARGYLSGPERERIRRDTRRRRPGDKGGPVRGSKRHRNALYIGVIELASIVYGALLWGHGWRDKMAVAITDSVNALRWIRQGRARNGYAAYLLRLLARLQLQHGFTLWVEWIPSKENDIPDCGSRLWREDGSLNMTEVARWQELTSNYSVPHLLEIQLSEEERSAAEWLDLDHPRIRSVTQPWWRPGGSIPEWESGDEEEPILPIGGRAGGAGDRRRLSERRREPGYVAQLGRDMVQLLSEAWAASTTEKYEGSKRQFIEFCLAVGRAPLLTGAHKAEDTETLALYATELATVQGLAHSTIVGKFSAVGWYHMKAGLPNPTKGAPLLKYLLKAIKRRQGEGAPRQPVTPAMLHAARDLLQGGSLRDATTWAGLLMGFGFLLRASEYLAHDDEGLFEEEKVIRWTEVTFRRCGEVVCPETSPEEPDEVVVKFRASKTDQFKAGCVRNLFATGLEDLCPVRALWALAKELGPDRRRGPVMVVPGEDPIGRREITDVLVRAATAVSESTERLSTHSLRAGGATALYAAGYSEKEITYHGRWASDSWLVYVHRTVARSGDVAKDMFSQKVSLLRLANTASVRVGGRSASSVSGPKGGRCDRKERSTGKLNQAPINRKPFPLVVKKMPPKPGVGSGQVCATPVVRERAQKGGRPGLDHKICTLQNIFGYGSPL
jgi:hypothetical protein